LKKEIKEDYNRLEDFLCSWIARINIVKWLYYQKQSTCSMQSHQNSIDIHDKDRKINPKVHLQAQKTMSSQGKEKEQNWKYHNTLLQTILQSHSNKKMHDTGTKTDIKTSGTK
jgi:hypothetical protein